MLMRGFDFKGLCVSRLLLPHLVRYVKHALLDLLVDLTGGVDERLHSEGRRENRNDVRDEPKENLQIRERVKETGAEDIQEREEKGGLVGNKAAVKAEVSLQKRNQCPPYCTSSTLCAVLADVSRKTRPCSLANASPSSVVTARRCCVFRQQRQQEEVQTRREQSSAV